MSPNFSTENTEIPLKQHSVHQHNPQLFPQGKC